MKGLSPGLRLNFYSILVEPLGSDIMDFAYGPSLILAEPTAQVLREVGSGLKLCK